MPLLTTTIGAFPKPDYLDVPDWFEGGGKDHGLAKSFEDAISVAEEELEALFVRGTRDAVRDQVASGIDIPTDGEIRRENYFHYHCRHLGGIDFRRMTRKASRGGTYDAAVPTVCEPLVARGSFLPRDWHIAQAYTNRPVKITVPGPLTIADTVADDFYGDPRKLCAALATVLNTEILALAAAGCRHIQIDEPVFARYADDALAFGIENLERCFAGCPPRVTRALHICCGYPDRLDNPDYPKAPNDAYLKLAGALDASSIDAVSIEDAHRPNDLRLLEEFGKTSIIFGAIAIASSHLETADEIGVRLLDALNHIDARRLIAAPDCGLGFLNRDLARQKMMNLTAAARAVGNRT